MFGYDAYSHHQGEWKEVRGPVVGSRWVLEVVVGFFGIGGFRDRLTSSTSGGDRIWRRWS